MKTYAPKKPITMNTGTNVQRPLPAADVVPQPKPPVAPTELSRPPMPPMPQQAMPQPMPQGMPAQGMPQGMPQGAPQTLGQLMQGDNPQMDRQMMMRRAIAQKLQNR